MADDALQPNPADPDALLGPSAVEAGVGALAERNRHHFEAMDANERAEALQTWRDLAADVLAAAHHALFASTDQPNRAVLVFEDRGGEDVAVHASFVPQLQEMGDEQVSGTPGQIMALSMLESLQDGGGSVGEDAP